MKNILFLLAACLSILMSCKKEPEPTPDTMARDTLYQLMNQWYYWYDKMPSIDKEDYSDPL